MPFKDDLGRATSDIVDHAERQLETGSDADRRIALRSVEPFVHLNLLLAYADDANLEDHGMTLQDVARVKRASASMLEELGRRQANYAVLETIAEPIVKLVTQVEESVSRLNKRNRSR